MKSLEEIKLAIEALPRQEYLKLVEWFSEQELTKKMTKLPPRMFANLVYLISEDDQSLLLINRKEYGKSLPVGKRLEYHEAPHEAALTAIKEQTSIEPKDVRFWPGFYSKKFLDLDGHIEIVPGPFQVQQEVHRGHKDNIPEHYDFVYVCITNSKSTPSGKNDPDGNKYPKWHTKDEVEHMHKKGETFADVYPTFVAILDALKESNILPV